MRYGDLSSQTELSESVFLELRTDLPQTVFVAENSTAGQKFHVMPTLKRDLVAAGYTIVDDPDDATYLIQINHRNLTEFELREGQTLGDAVGAAIAAGGTTALITDEILGLEGAAAEVGLAAGLIGFVLDAKTKHIAHTLTTDVLITETVPVNGETDLRYHEVQIVSGASKVNLKLADSLPTMVDGLCGSLAGLMPARPAR